MKTAKVHHALIDRDFLILFLTATVILITKLIISFRVMGSSDVTSWYTFASFIQKYGTFNIYPHIAYYNHPPFISWLLKYIPLHGALRSPFLLKFPFLLRLLPILADFGSVFVIWKLLTYYRNQNRALICMLCCLSPINFLVSGYHGNMDAIFMFLTLLAIYHFEKQNIVAGGVMYALSLCIKIVPLMLAPFIFYYLKPRDRVVLFLILLTMFFVVYLPYLVFDPRSLIVNIFQYGGGSGTWGIGHILYQGIVNENLFAWIRKACQFIYTVHIGLFVELFFLLLFFLARSLMKQKKVTLLESCFLVFSLFLTLTPGFGIQYLSWLSFFAVIVSPVLGFSYLIVGGLFLFRVYAFWASCDLLKQEYVPCTGYTGPWYGFETALDIVLWLFVVGITVLFLICLRNGHGTARSAL